MIIPSTERISGPPLWTDSRGFGQSLWPANIFVVQPYPHPDRADGATQPDALGDLVRHVRLDDQEIQVAPRRRVAPDVRAEQDDDRATRRMA